MSGWGSKSFVTQPEHLPVSDASRCAATLFLWSSVHLIERSLTLLKTWGFLYYGMLIWKSEDLIENEQTMENHVIVLIGSKGGLQVTDGQKPLSIIEDNGQGSRHDQVRAIIDKMYPNKKKLELLAHEKANGWDLYNGDGAV